jgi:hypothetical protein
MVSLKAGKSVASAEHWASLLRFAAINISFPNRAHHIPRDQGLDNMD